MCSTSTSDRRAASSPSSSRQRAIEIISAGRTWNSFPHPVDSHSSIVSTSAVAVGGRLILANDRHLDEPYIDPGLAAHNAGLVVSDRFEIPGAAIAWIEGNQ
jgi:hypothetical protein